MSGKRVEKIIYHKLKKIQDDIDTGNRFQKRAFFYALAGSFVVLACTYYPAILQKLGIDTLDFYVYNFSGFLGIAAFVLIYSILITRKARKEIPREKKEEKSTITETLITLSISLFSLSLLNKSLDSSEDISNLSKTITSGWYYVAILGLIMLAFGVYFKLPNHKVQQWLLNNMFFYHIVKAFKFFSWAIILVLFGRNVIEIMQSAWTTVIGLFCMLVGLSILAYSVIYSLVMGIILSNPKNKYYIQNLQLNSKQEV